MAEGWPKKRRLLGTKVRRLDGPDKATGRAKYSYDVTRPGMIYGAILRSPYAHAKVKSLDTAAAKQVPGFKALAMIGVAKDGVVSEVDAAAGKLVYTIPSPANKKKDDPAKKDPSVTVQVTPAVTLLRQNKVVKLA